MTLVDVESFLIDHGFGKGEVFAGRQLWKAPHADDSWCSTEEWKRLLEGKDVQDGYRSFLNAP